MHTYQYFSWPAYFVGLFGLLLAGCTPSVGNDIRVPVGELALHESMPKKDAIAKLERHLKEAENYNMPFLAPHYYREALDLLKDMHSSSPKDVSVYDLAKGDAIIDRGDAVVDKVRSQLGNELELKELLEKQNADEIYHWQYKAAINHLSKLIEKVELDRAGNIERDIKALNENMQELYDKVVQYNLEHDSNSVDKATTEMADEK